MSTPEMQALAGELQTLRQELLLKAEAGTHPGSRTGTARERPEASINGRASCLPSVTFSGRSSLIQQPLYVLFKKCGVGSSQVHKCARKMPAQEKTSEGSTSLKTIWTRQLLKMGTKNESERLHNF